MGIGTLAGGVMTAATALAGGVMAAGGWGDGVEEKHTETLPHVDGAAVRVRTEDGSVSIKRDENADEVRVVVLRRASSDDALSKIDYSVQRAADGALEISATVAPTSWRQWASCSFEIHVPSANGVDVATEDGSIALSGLAGPATLITEDGSVAVRGHDGTVSVHTGDGSISVTETTGEVVAITGDGSVAVSEAGGAVRIETGDGSIAVKHAKGEVIAVTGDGAVAVSEPDGPVRIETGDGSISVKGAAHSVHAEAGDGSIAIEFDEGAPGPVFAQTDDGSITVQLSPAFRGRLVASADDGRAIFKSAHGTSVKEAGEQLEIEFGASGEESVVRSGDGSVVIQLVGGGL